MTRINRVWGTICSVLAWWILTLSIVVAAWCVAIPLNTIAQGVETNPLDGAAGVLGLAYLWFIGTLVANSIRGHVRANRRGR